MSKMTSNGDLFYRILPDGEWRQVNAEEVKFVDMGVVDCDSKTIIATSQEYGDLMGRELGLPYRVRVANGELGPLTFPAAAIDTDLEDDRPAAFIDTELE